MPVFPPARQDTPPAWFATAQVQVLRQAEHTCLHEQLRPFPTQPWLWLAPESSWLPDPLPSGRGIALYRATEGVGWCGDIRCALPLPLPSQALNAIVLEHVVASELEAVLAECARLLMPGGRVWLSMLNRFSPYRSHWQRREIRSLSLARCRNALQREGLYVRAVHHCGPLIGDQTSPPRLAWLKRLRAVCIVEAEKRRSAFIGPQVVKSTSWCRPMLAKIAVDE